VPLRTPPDDLISGGMVRSCPTARQGTDGLVASPGVGGVNCAEAGETGAARAAAAMSNAIRPRNLSAASLDSAVVRENLAVERSMGPRTVMGSASG
jgi:hypothetical protein